MPEIINTPLFADANLQAYYQLTPGTFLSNAAPSTPGLFALTNNNSVGQAPGKFGYCADFGTGNTNKFLSAASNINCTGARSMSFWFKAYAEITTSQWEFINLADSTTKSSFFVLYNYNGGSRQVEFHRIKQTVVDDSMPVTIALGTGWNHFVLTWNAFVVTGYINTVASPPMSTSIVGVTGGDGLQIGIGPYSTPASGYIDDVAIFNRALTTNEIAQIYANNVGGFFNVMV